MPCWNAGIKTSRWIEDTGNDDYSTEGVDLEGVTEKKAKQMLPAYSLLVDLPSKVG
jgi:hypothetical protein